MPDEKHRGTTFREIQKQKIIAVGVVHRPWIIQKSSFTGIYFYNLRALQQTQKQQTHLVL